ncbi:zinc finger BED domain-containing protein RICESLEEPER 2 [Tanacetum coccineum]
MASESASFSTATGVGSTSSPIIREIIATNRNPNIWKDFNLCIMTDNSQKAQCKHCFHFLSVGSNTTLKNHISHPHCEAKKAQQNQNPEAGQTSMARDGSVFRTLCNQDTLIRCVAHIINLVVQAGLGVPAIDAIIESFKTMLKDIFKSSVRTRQRYVKIRKDAEKPCLRPNWDVQTRWNSTYHMFLSGLKQQTTFAYYHDVLANKNRWVYYPTSPLALQQIFFMSTALSEYELEGAALNPCFNVNGVDYLIESISMDLEFFEDTFASKSKSYFNESLEGFYNLYYAKYGNPTQSSQTSGRATSSKVRTDPTMSSEYERYVNSDFVTHLHPKEFASFDVLGFWKEKETMFPVLSRMAMDIISVQASSVASESAFSTSGRVLSIRRTRLTPASLEMCMCLKDHLDAKERKQDKCPLKIPLDFEEGVFDDEVQQNEAIPLSDE